MSDSSAACWLGIDLGTSSVKVILLDQTGKVLSSESRQTAADVSSDAGDCGYEQDPAKIMEVTEALVLTTASPYKDRIKGVGITGQMHGVLLWSKEKQNSGSPRQYTRDSAHHTNLYTWQDQRCSEQFLSSLPTPGNPYQKMSTGYGCATLFWLTHHRKTLVRDQTFTACGTVMDYLVCRLCGLDHPVTSDHLAASFGYYNKETQAWDEVLSKSDSFPHHLLPHIVPAGKVVGHTLEVPGIPKDIPVLVAMGDVQCAMQAVLNSPQDAAVNISTSIQLGFAVRREEKVKVAENSPACISFFPYFDGQELALFAGLNGGNAIHCFAESIAQWVSDLGIANNINPASLLPKLQSLAENVRTRSSSSSSTSSPPKVSISPVLFGERHDMSLKASISGMDYASLSNVGLLFHALSEGVVDHLHSMVSPEYLARQGVARLHVSGSVPTSNLAVLERLRELYSGSAAVDISIGNKDKGCCVEASSQVSGIGRGDDGEVKSSLEVIMDTTGLEAVGSAVGAAKVAQRYTGL